MGFNERNLTNEFTVILEQYKTSPFGFRMRRTGNSLKFTEYNGLFYLDIQNLFNIVDELLGPNIPNEMIEYLEKIVFAEEITIENRNGYQTKLVTCTQFIDNRFFNKCDTWIKQKLADSSIKDQTAPFNLSYRDLAPIDGYIPNNPSDTMLTLDDMFPFKEIFRMESPPNNGSSVLETYSEYSQKANQKYMPYTRPRGKQMNEASKKTADRPFACEVPFCNRAFKRYEHLKRHMKMHSGERPFKCEHPGCSKSFSRSDNLNQHYKIHNVGMKNPNVYFDMLERNFDEY